MSKRQNSKDRAQSRRTVRFLFALWHISPWLTWLMVATQAIAAMASNIIAPLFVSHLMTSIARGSATVHNSTRLIIGYIVCFVVGDVIIFRLTLILAYVSQARMQERVAQQVFKNQIDKSMNFHANHMGGGLVSDMTKLNGSIERFWDVITFNAAPVLTSVIGVSIVLSFLVWQYALILLALAAVMAVIMVNRQNQIAPITRATSEKSSAVTAYFADAITNIATIKSFAGGAFEQATHAKKLREWRLANLHELKHVVINTTLFNVLFSTINSIAFVGAIVATEHHWAQIGTIYLMISYTLNVTAQLWQINNITRTYIRILGDAGPMIAMLDEPLELTDPDMPEPVRITRGAIAFKDVVFRHSGSSDAIFDGLNLHIKPGEKVGLVGHSGSGKTTLTRLLLRFSDIQAGAIEIDGQNIARITQDDLRRRIAYVPQEPLLFHRSIADNIAYGELGASQEAIEAAAKMASAHEFIQTLPQGYDTLVGERGVKLSGGQRQRIAIARALLKNAPILVLDEATSALDSESEALIQQALWKLMENRTAIVIAHRLSTIQQMDRIIVLDHGRIVEQGSHKELVRKKDGVYAGLWVRQSGGFIEE